MRKRNGFVMIETIVVIAILSVGLISLYASYSLILSKAVNKSHYDSVEYIYKSYFVSKYLEEKNYTDFPLDLNFKEIETDSDDELKKIADNFNIKKIYLAQGVYNNIIARDHLLTLDGSTIAYLRAMNSYDETKINVIVKFVEENEDSVLNVTYFASITL